MWPRTRRDFLRSASCTGAAVALSSCGKTPVMEVALVEGKVHVPLDRFDALVGRGRGAWVLPPGLMFPIILLKKPEGGYAALSAQCSHQACHVRPTRSYLGCTCHGSRFDFDGQVTRGPAPFALKRYELTVHPDRIEIAL